MTFDEKYETGHAQIDAEHRDLFMLLRATVDAVEDNDKKGVNVEDAIDFLAKYVLNHFATEENIMELSDFPGYALHKKQHDDFVIAVVDLRRRVLAETDRKKAGHMLMSAVSNWVDSHVLDSDMEMAAHYKKWMGEEL